MTPAERVARVLAEHLPDEPHWSRVVIAAEVIKALGLQEERLGPRTSIVRFVTAWREVES